MIVALRAAVIAASLVSIPNLGLPSHTSNSPRAVKSSRLRTTLRPIFSSYDFLEIRVQLDMIRSPLELFCLRFPER
jgi:hypothetical protein